MDFKTIQGKQALNEPQSTLICGLLKAYLGHLKSMPKKYLFIAILCVKMSRVNKA